jgi:hypothetical protein
MNWNDSEEIRRQHSENRLPRGLEQVSHLFLSQAKPDHPAEEGVRGLSPNESPPPGGDRPLTVLSRQFIERPQLLSLLRKQAALLEEGMRVIDTHIPCEAAGSIELLALDHTNQLVIIDCDDSPDNGLLLRGLGHLDWMVRNIAIVGRMYAGQPINGSIPPRLFFVAPDFSVLFKSSVRQLKSVRMDCVKYQALALAGETGIFFEHVFRSRG